MKMSPVAPLVVGYLERKAQCPPKLGVRAWDGSVAGPSDGPVVVLTSPRALVRFFYRPGQLGWARAFVAGEVDVEGDLSLFLRHAMEMFPAFSRPTLADRVHMLHMAYRLRMAALPLRPPPEEKGNRLSAQDAVAHHYDVGNAFYARMLGPSMVYSCAYWPQPPIADAPADGLDEAQAAKLDLVCRKLALRPGMRLLDVGCGWGTLVCHAAREYGVTAVGVTLSREQADYASRQIADAGLDKQVSVRHSDFREVTDGPFDAIASVEMAQHVGIGALPHYATTLHGLLKPGGRLLDHHMNAHGIGLREQYSPFITRYIFPDLDMASLHRSIAVFERAGFEIYDVENLRAHFAPTMHAWQANLERHWDTACSLIGVGRARAWRVYLAGAALMLDTGLVGINHFLLIRPHTKGPGPLAPRRTADVAARPSYAEGPMGSRRKR